MSEESTEDTMHLDVLLEDEFSKFVADGLRPDIVVGAYRDRINLGIDARDGSVDVYLGNLGVDDARALARVLLEAAEAVESSSVDERGRSWTVPNDG